MYIFKMGKTIKKKKKVEKFSCDSDKAECMLEKCESCKSSVMIDKLFVEESLEDEDSKDSSESN